MRIEHRRAVLEGIIAGEDATPTDRLRSLAELRELDALETEARFQRQPQEPYHETEPERIEKILRLALQHVGGALIEARAREIAEERRSRLVSKR